MAQGCAATVCMPLTTPAIKVDAVRRLGGRVDLHGDSYSETQTYAQVHALTPVKDLGVDMGPGCVLGRLSPRQRRVNSCFAMQTQCWLDMPALCSGGMCT